MVDKSHTVGWCPSVYEPLRQIGQSVADWFAPRSDASAMEDYYEINVELPGVKAEDVDVSVHNNSLQVSGEKSPHREEKGQTFFFSEREYGAFQRTFRLPAGADQEMVEASFSDGVLRLRIAKRSVEAPKGKKIEVRPL